MGLSNDTILSGHLGLNLSWSGDHHHRHFRGSVPVPADDRDWLTKYYGRAPAKVGKGFKIEYTDMMKKKIPVITQSTESPKKINKNAISNLVAPKDYAARLWKALTDYGFPGNSINFVYAMCYMESGHWSNGPARKDNNPGNIMWYPGKTKGTYIPDNKTYVIHFNNLDQFAAELYKTLSKGANPLGATTLEDYVRRLGANGYFGTADPTAYLQAMRGAMDDLDAENSKYADTWREKQVKQRGNDPGNDKKKWPWWGYALAGLGGLIIIKKVMD